MYPFFVILLRDEKNIHKAYHLKRVWSRLICFLTAIKVIVKGRSNLPNRPYVICANHASYLDIVVTFCVIPQTAVFLGKAELLKWPFVRAFFKNMDIPVDRSNRKKAAQSIELTKEAIQKGYSVVIFPEGMIPDEDRPKMHKFKNGAFNLAISQQADIVPITFKTNWLLFSHHGDLFGQGIPGISRSIIHKPISTKGLTDKDLVHLKDQVFEVIEKPLKQYYK